MSKHGCVSITLIICIGVLSGCATNPTPAPNPDTQSVSVAGEKPRPERASRFQLNEERRREIEELVNEATVGPSIAARSAAAWAAADQSTAQMGELLDAIDAARQIVVSNVRNADTTGFRGIRCSINNQTISRELDMSQGELNQTTYSLDLAIQGDGFFVVQLDAGHPSKLACTREGSFYLNAKDELILGLGEGYRLSPPITFPLGASNITIGEDGTITCALDGASEKRTLGHLELAHFRNPRAMTYDERSACYLPNERSGPAIISPPGTLGAGTIELGFLENSNVDLMRERLRLRFLNEWQNAIEQALANSGPSRSQ